MGFLTATISCFGHVKCRIFVFGAVVVNNATVVLKGAEGAFLLCEIRRAAVNFYCIVLL